MTEKQIEKTRVYKKQQPDEFYEKSLRKFWECQVVCVRVEDNETARKVASMVTEELGNKIKVEDVYDIDKEGD